MDYFEPTLWHILLSGYIFMAIYFLTSVPGHHAGGKILELIQHLCKNTEDHRQPSPETSQQIDMVLSWVEGE